MKRGKRLVIPPSTRLQDPQPSVPKLLAPPVGPVPHDRCPATTQQTLPYSALTVGVQCKYTVMHEGDHAGYAGPGTGDVFWPQEREGGEVRE